MVFRIYRDLLVLKAWGRRGGFGATVLGFYALNPTLPNLCQKRRVEKFRVQGGSTELRLRLRGPSMSERGKKD